MAQACGMGPWFFKDLGFPHCLQPGCEKFEELQILTEKPRVVFPESQGIAFLEILMMPCFPGALCFLGHCVFCR